MTGRDSPGIFSNEHESGTYKLDTGRMSPSSWDSDSNEEDADSYWGLTEINTLEDRRHRLPRLKRRKNLDKSWENYSVIPNFQTFRERSDWDPDEIILDIENFLKDQSFIYSKSDYQSDNAEINNREGIANFRNLSVRLSRILEVEESITDVASESSIVSPLKIDDKIYDCKGKTDEYEISGRKSGSSEESYITMSLPEERDISNESNSDESERIWTRIRKRIKKKDEELVGIHHDSQEFKESLAHFFQGQKQGYQKDGLGKQNSALRESRVNTREDELSESFPAKMERKFDKDKISIDGVEDVRDCTALTDELGTPKRDGNLTGKTIDHALFRESNRTGSGEPFPLRKPMFPILSGGENSQHNLSNNRTECFLASPASRDTHIINQSITWNISNESKNSKDKIYEPENLRFSSDLSEKSPCSPEGDIFFKSNNRKWKSVHSGDNGSSSSFFNILLDLNDSDNEDKCSTAEKQIFRDSPSESNVTRKSSAVWGYIENGDKNPTSPVFKFVKTGKSPVTKTSRAENEDSTSNVHFLDYEQCLVGDNEWNTGPTDSKNTDRPQDQGDVKYENNAVKSEWGKLALTLDEESKIQNNATVFWIDLKENVRTDYFQDDCNRKILAPESYITTNGVKRNTKRKISNVNLAQKRIQTRKRKRENNVESFVSQVNQSSYLLRRKGDKCRFVKKFTLKKNKSTHAKGNVPDSFLITDRNYSSGTYKHLSINHTSHFSDSSAFNCFRSLFKQLANAYTVFWQKIRNFTV